jgi:hypothetical protein
VKKALNKIGKAALVSGMLGCAVGLLIIFGYVAYVVVPFFYERGDYSPLAFLIILSLIVGGAILVAATEPDQ